MQRMGARTCAAGLLAGALVLGMPAWAEIGQVKVARGAVTVERQGQTLPVRVGLMLEAADVLRTGPDGSVGVTMRDNSLLSAGPNSVLALERFEFDATTSAGRFESRLQRGTLAVVSGRIAKQSPQAMTVRTPSAVLGVRGTEFAVTVQE
ncbi:MAG TPA: FecR family protein [Burkholderiaceae bacterium]|nr:FecR family protein [Burkholderiaceae bacterium]